MDPLSVAQDRGYRVGVGHACRRHGVNGAGVAQGCHGGEVQLLARARCVREPYQRLAVRAGAPLGGVGAAGTVSRPVPVEQRRRPPWCVAGASGALQRAVPGGGGALVAAQQGFDERPRPAVELIRARVAWAAVDAGGQQLGMGVGLVVDGLQVAHTGENHRGWSPPSSSRRAWSTRRKCRNIRGLAS